MGCDCRCWQRHCGLQLIRSRVYRWLPGSCVLHCPLLAEPPAALPLQPHSRSCPPPPPRPHKSHPLSPRPLLTPLRPPLPAPRQPLPPAVRPAPRALGYSSAPQWCRREACRPRGAFPPGSAAPAAAPAGPARGPSRTPGSRRGPWGTCPGGRRRAAAGGASARTAKRRVQGAGRRAQGRRRGQAGRQARRLEHCPHGPPGGQGTTKSMSGVRLHGAAYAGGVRQRMPPPYLQQRSEAQERPASCIGRASLA